MKNIVLTPEQEAEAQRVAAIIAKRAQEETRNSLTMRQVLGEVARRFRNRDTGGEIGVIASVTQPFCRDCTRARLSSDGKLYTCLFASHGHDLRTPLRSGATDGELAGIIRKIWCVRDDRYSEIRATRTQRKPKVEMSHIGG